MHRYNRPQQTPLQMLMQMGFSQKRAQKALAATGDRSVQLASDWLAAHLNDPSLDELSPREYVVYIRPTGPLSIQIYNFWQEVLESVGRNAAQNLMPHITLCSYFAAPDECSAILSDLLTSAVTSVLSSSPLPLPLSLDRYTSQNYMGLFVTSYCLSVLKKIKRQFVQSASGVCPGLSNLSLDEDLHLTLAYSFTPMQYPKLESLVKNIDSSVAATWEICLYSREARIKGQEVYRAGRNHEPQHKDELVLMCGDYIYINKESWSKANDGWVMGTSWLTGCTGLVHEAYISRVPESDAWTLHRGLTITADGSSVDITDGIASYEDVNVESQNQPTVSLRASQHEPLEQPDKTAPGSCITPQHKCGLSSSLLNLLDHSEGSRRSTTAHSEASSTDRPLPPVHHHHSREGSIDCGAHDPQFAVPLAPQEFADSHEYATKTPPPVRSTSLPPLHTFPIPGPRKLYVMRHGERCDFCFGSEWVKASFSDDGRYSRADLNLQANIPERANVPACLIKDGPLTRIGELQAQLVGEGFAATQTAVHHVFVSPALRCIMTATNVLKALNIAHRMPLKIEPGLFEWLAWHQEGVPQFMTLEELINAGFNIDTSYKPVITLAQLKELDTSEKCEQYYTRSGHITNAILANTKHQGGSVLFVAHGASLDTCTRQLVGGHPRSSSNMVTQLKKVPYCAVAAVEENTTEGLWNIVEPPFRNPMHSANISYDWTIWLQ